MKRFFFFKVQIFPLFFLLAIIFAAAAISPVKAQDSTGEASVSEKAVDLFKAGIKFFEAEKYAEAARQFELAIKDSPRYPEAYNALGSVYTNLNRNTEAADSFREAIRLKPDYASAFYNLGNLFDRLGSPDVAIENLQQAIKLAPDYTLAYGLLGNVYLGIKRYDLAASAFEQAIRRQPENAWLYSKLGFTYNSLEQYKPALEAYREARRLTPGDLETRNNFAVTLYYLKRFGEAKAEFEKLIGEHPDYAAAHFNFIVLHLAMKNRDAAFKELNLLRKLQPELAEQLVTLMYSDQVVRVNSEK